MVRWKLCEHYKLADIAKPRWADPPLHPLGGHSQVDETERSSTTTLPVLWWVWREHTHTHTHAHTHTHTHTRILQSAIFKIHTNVFKSPTVVLSSLHAWRFQSRSEEQALTSTATIVIADSTFPGVKTSSSYHWMMMSPVETMNNNAYLSTSKSTCGSESREHHESRHQPLDRLLRRS